MSYDVQEDFSDVQSLEPQKITASVWPPKANISYLPDMWEEFMTHNPVVQFLPSHVCRPQ
jgi:hypothetical protein